VLVQRLLTAMIGIPIILGLVAIGGWPFTLVAAGVAALATREAVTALDLSAPRSAVADRLSMVAAFLLVVLAGLGQSVFIVGILVLVCFSASLSLWPTIATSWSVALAATLYGSLPLAILALLRVDVPGPTSLQVAHVHLSPGAIWVYAALTSVWAVDSAAYLVGRAIGRHPFWPRVSPKKTWEGTIAGIIGGVLVWLAWSPATNQSLAVAVVVGLSLSGAAILGDLAESAIKRSAGLKDASTLLPGHGGLLDRLDSLGFASVVVFVCRIIVGG